MEANCAFPLKRGDIPCHAGPASVSFPVCPRPPPGLGICLLCTSHLKRFFWLRVHCAPWIWGLSTVLEISLLFLKHWFFSFFSSSWDSKTDNLDLLPYTPCSFIVYLIFCSTFWVNAPKSFSAHQHSLKPWLNSPLICLLRFLKAFVLISRVLFCYFHNMPDLLARGYCFFFPHVSFLFA